MATSAAVDDAWSLPVDEPAVALLLPASGARRTRLASWAAAQVPTTLWADDQRLSERLDELDAATLVVPVGVVGGRRAARVCVGEPATIADLRSRCPESRDLGAFVRRQAALAVDRAERRVIGNAYKVPQGIVEEIAATARYADAVSRLSEQTGRPRDDIDREARGCLDEMSAQQSRWAIDVWNRIGGWMSRAYSADADDEAIARLKELNRRHALVFLPNHRSYLDPVVLRSVLAPHGFPPNHVLGGINLNFWPLGPIGKRNGLVFIRRSIRDDPVYRAMLGEYLNYLVSKRFNLEWYIEGGRTRTGKLRPPKYGVLSYLVDAFSEGSAEDVLIVPVSIVYDQQHEVGAISAEELGGTKSAESVSWLVNFARAQSRRLGKVHVRFGPPLSLREEIDKVGEADARASVPKVAFEISHRINEVTPIMPTALVTFALLDNDGRALTVAEGRRILDPLIDYIRARGLPMTSDVSYERDGVMSDALTTLVSEGVVDRFDGGTEAVYRIADNRLHEAAFYRNTLIHFLVTRAIGEVALIRVAEEQASDVPAVLWDEALRLRDLLKFEFFFMRKREFNEEILAEVALASPSGAPAAWSWESVIPTLEATGLYTAHRVLGPFLESYSILADRLAAVDPDEQVDERQMIESCIGIARQKWLQREMRSPEAISKDIYTSAQRLAENRGLLDAGSEGLAERRREFAEEVRGAVRRINVIRSMAREALLRGSGTE